MKESKTRSVEQLAALCRGTKLLGIIFLIIGIFIMPFGLILWAAACYWFYLSHKYKKQHFEHPDYKPDPSSVPVEYDIEYNPPIDISKIKETVKPDYKHQAYAKTFAFVGEMEKYSIETAMQKVVNVGGVLSDVIARDVDYVIWGQYSDEKNDELIDKAYELKLEVLNEDDFSDLLKNKY